MKKLRKKILIFMCMITLLVPGYNVFAGSGRVSQNQDMKPYITSCCGRPIFIYENRWTQHVYATAGVCVVHINKGDKRCKRCGALWEKGATISTTSGCGRRGHN